MPTILVRKISGYLGPDILLGVFASTQEAEQHRAAYFSMRTQGSTSDPWREQPYKPAGLQMADLLVLKVQGSEVSAGKRAFVISSYSEGFGQTVRRFFSVHGDNEIAKRQCARLEQADTDSFPNYYRIQEARVGQLLQDDPDVQPDW